MVTDATRKLLAAADSDSSYLVANELIKRRHDADFVRSVINDESQIEEILRKIEIKIQELGGSGGLRGEEIRQKPQPGVPGGRRRASD
jgi:plasmid segregation protein ParM